jgi:hypothetical protein
MPSAVERCLFITEVARTIAHHVRELADLWEEGYPNLQNLSRTCRAFHEVCLDVRWADTGFECLAEEFPESVWCPPEGAEGKLEWERSQKVRIDGSVPGFWDAHETHSFSGGPPRRKTGSRSSIVRAV